MAVPVRLEAMLLDRFATWAESSRAGFAAQQVASGSMPAQEARDYAEREFATLLPDGLGTPGHHIWTVHEGEVEVGHLWIRITDHSDAVDAFVLDVALDPEARGRGLGKATMLAAESAARSMGATRMRLNVFGHNAPAHRLYENLGFGPAATMMTRRLDTSTPLAFGDRPLVVLQPMRQAQFDGYRGQAEQEYAANVAASGMLPVVEARRKAAADYAHLLPDGLTTAEHHFWTAHEHAPGSPAGPGIEVGMLWLHIAPKSDGLHAFGYDFSVRDGLRRHGYGRAIMVAAEEICRDQGVVSVGLNVFGSNPGARALYEQMGFGVAAQLLKKELR